MFLEKTKKMHSFCTSFELARWPTNYCNMDRDSPPRGGGFATASAAAAARGAATRGCAVAAAAPRREAEPFAPDDEEFLMVPSGPPVLVTIARATSPTPGALPCPTKPSVVRGAPSQSVGPALTPLTQRHCSPPSAGPPVHRSGSEHRAADATAGSRHTRPRGSQAAHLGARGDKMWVILRRIQRAYFRRNRRTGSRATSVAVRHRRRVHAHMHFSVVFHTKTLPERGRSRG